METRLSVVWGGDEIPGRNREHIVVHNDCGCVLGCVEKVESTDEKLENAQVKGAFRKGTRTI